MPRMHLCIICAALAALIALLVLLAPTPAMADNSVTPAGNEPAKTADKPAAIPNSVEFGEGDKMVGEIQCNVMMLGTSKPQAGFKLLAMAKYPDRSSPTREILSDGKGAFTIKLRSKSSELRLFAFGDFVVPDGWSNVPLSTMKFEKAETWEVFIRPLHNVRLSGTVTVAPSGGVGANANVVLAPLDVARDGSTQLFDQPFSTVADDDGSYSFEVPTGYYMLWAYWTDRTKTDWVGYVAVQHKVEVFGDKTLSLKVVEGPYLKGKVIDARTGEGVGANINLYSNLYLKHLGVPTADGHFADEYKPDGTEIKWPVGTFKKQVWMIDPANFTVVIRPDNTQAVMRILPNLSAAGVTGKDIVWKLYTDDMSMVDIQVTTHKQDIPIERIDVQLLPRDVEVPAALKLNLAASGTTDVKGWVKFLGLPTGDYEVYGVGGSALLGKLRLEGKGPQTAKFKYEIPFAFGKVKLEAGEICKHLMVFWTMTDAEGRTRGPYPADAYRDSAVLREQGLVFVPLLQRNVTFKLRFAAFEKGREFKESEWANLGDFPLVTEEKEIKVVSEDAWEVDLTLKANPDYRKPEDKKKDEGKKKDG